MCTTTNLPLCNNTIVVLKIMLLNTVSIITNFVIQKCDKEKHFFVHSRCMAHDPHHAWHGDRGPCHFCTPLTFFDPISSFAHKGC